MRPLITIKPVALTTLIESSSRKPTNSPVTERKRGRQHVGKVLKTENYILSKGEVMYSHESLILPSQDQEMFSKVIDTRSERNPVEI